VKSLYALILEKLSRDIAISTAAGVTAGMRAAIGDSKSGQTIESRVEIELDAVFGEILNPPAIIAASPTSIGDGGVQNTALPKRGPGRPRKSPLPEVQ
jgi:hypothetical protein